MNDGLRQRIIGALVLLVLALIFLPMVFNFKGIRDIQRESRIPPAPQIEPVTVPEPVRPARATASKPIKETYQFEESRAEQEEATGDSTEQPTVKPGLNDQGLPLGWVIQVGSFRERDKAEALESKLLKDDYRAYIREARRSGQVLYRVYVGPSIDKTQALADQKRIDAEYGVKSLLLRFEA